MFLCPDPQNGFLKDINGENLSVVLVFLLKVKNLWWKLPCSWYLLFFLLIWYLLGTWVFFWASVSHQDFKSHTTPIETNGNLNEVTLPKNEQPTSPPEKIRPYTFPRTGSKGSSSRFFYPFFDLNYQWSYPPKKKSNMNMSPKKYSGWPRRNDVLFMVVMGMKLPSFPKGQPQKGTRTQNITARSTYLPPPTFPTWYPHQKLRV